MDNGHDITEDTRIIIKNDGSSITLHLQVNGSVIATGRAPVEFVTHPGQAVYVVLYGAYTLPDQ